MKMIRMFFNIVCITDVAVEGVLVGGHGVAHVALAPQEGQGAYLVGDHGVGASCQVEGALAL